MLQLQLVQDIVMLTPGQLVLIHVNTIKEELFQQLLVLLVKRESKQIQLVVSGPKLIMPLKLKHHTKSLMINQPVPGILP